MRRSATRRHAVDRSCPIGSRRAGPVNASVLTVKLASAIIGISSIHLLRTFIDAAA